MRLVLQHSKAKAGPEYVITLVDYYAKEHSKNIKLRTAPTHNGNHLIIKKRPFLPLLLTLPLPVNIFLDKQWNGNYQYLTSEQVGKLARGIVELLLKDAKLCGCSDHDLSSSYLEVISVLEAGAQIVFEQLYHRFRADIQSCLVLEHSGNKVTKRSPGRWWNLFRRQWLNRTAVQGKHCDRKNKKPTTMPKQIQVKYLKKH